MTASIYPIKLGINCCYLIREQGTILIDAGVPRKIKAFIRGLKKIPLEPNQIRLIVLTHWHFDHIGSVAGIKELTGARILIHKDDIIGRKKEEMDWPKGVNRWGKISRTIFKFLLKKEMILPVIEPDIIMDTEEMDLSEWGIKGKIIHTPGHTPGSVSVLLDSGDFFAGCLAHNNFPFRFSPGLPIYADDIEMVIKSWHYVLSLGVKRVYPAHGNPFPVNRMQKILKDFSSKNPWIS